MLPSFRVVVLSLCSTAVAACGFDSNGLATGSNSAGTLESSGGVESSDGNDDTLTTTTPTTSPTGSSTLTSGSEESSSTTPPSTTQEPTESSGGATDSTGADGSEASSSDPSLGTSSDGEGSSSESGVPSDDPYRECSESADCDGGMCVPLSLEGTYYEVCYPPCGPKVECPAPTSGEAEPTCTDSGCGLDCDAEGPGDGSVSCPDGMVCGYTPKNNRRCLWQ